MDVRRFSIGLTYRCPEITLSIYQLLEASSFECRVKSWQLARAPPYVREARRLLVKAQARSFSRCPSGLREKLK
jgi:hypothetical protein